MTDAATSYSSQDTRYSNLPILQPNIVEEAPIIQDPDQYLKLLMLKIQFFHPGMSRHIAECVLLENGQVGSYVFRASGLKEGEIPDRFALSVRCFQSVKHYEVSRMGEGFEFGMGKFNSIDEFVEHFNNYPVIGGDSGVLTMLKFPYPRSIDEGTIYDEIKVHAEWKNNNSIIDDIPEQNNNVLSIASKEGYLTKLGFYRKNWKLRWFVCFKMILEYYDAKGAKNPIRRIDLNQALNASTDETHGRQNCFQLVVPGRIFIFQANSESEAKDWVKLLKWKLANKVIPIR